MPISAKAIVMSNPTNIQRQQSGRRGGGALNSVALTCMERITEDRSRLESEKSNFEAQKRSLEAQIAQVNEVMPLAVQLKAMGFDFALANSWLNCVAEMVQRKGLDLRSAAWRLADDLKNWQELGGFETAISNAKHQLNLLCLATDQQKQAIGIIVDLKKSGMTDEDISNLVKVVSKSSSKVGQGNGSSFELDNRLNLQNTPPCPPT
jgi:hypothetical protein